MPEHTGMLPWLVIDRLDAKEEDNSIKQVTHRWRSEGNSYVSNMHRVKYAPCQILHKDPLLPLCVFLLISVS